MTGVATLKGTWLVLVVAAIPILVSEVAAAAPGYPVAEPAGGTVVVEYNETDHILAVNTTNSSTTDSLDVTVPITESVTGVVDGPNGQVNHGQIMKQLLELTEGPTSGCITSSVAQSDLGKKNVGSASDSDGSNPALVEIDCEKPEHPENPSSGKSSNESPDSLGKSGQAPGKNK